ncbi:MAG: hydrogen peroxide-inducible genes activator [Flavobacteriales bacterium AspAUS03]
MTIKQLQYLLSVAEHKNFTSAAERSFVTQPTLSMQVQKLEEELGIELLDRTSHPIVPTRIGGKIIEQAKIALNELLKIQDIIHEEKGGVEDTFTLGIIPTVMPTLLPIFLMNFLKKFPKMTLKIREATTEQMIQELKENALDVGIAATPLENSMIIEHPLYYEPLVAFVPNTHSLFKKEILHPNDLNITDILLFKEDHCFHSNILNICENRKTKAHLKVHFESGSLETLLKLAKEGLGITLLPQLQAENLEESDQKLIKKFVTPPPTREVSIIYHKSQLKLFFIQALVEMIKNLIRSKLLLESSNISKPTIKIAI